MEARVCGLSLPAPSLPSAPWVTGQQCLPRRGVLGEHLLPSPSRRRGCSRSAQGFVTVCDRRTSVTPCEWDAALCHGVMCCLRGPQSRELQTGWNRTLTVPVLEHRGLRSGRRRGLWRWLVLPRGRSQGSAPEDHQAPRGRAAPRPCFAPMASSAASQTAAPPGPVGERSWARRVRKTCLSGVSGASPPRLLEENGKQKWDVVL